MSKDHKIVTTAGSPASQTNKKGMLEQVEMMMAQMTALANRLRAQAETETGEGIVT